jgi:hypothetical protein
MKPESYGADSSVPPTSGYIPTCSVEVYEWGQISLTWNLKTGAVEGNFDNRPQFNCIVQPGERKDFYNLLGERGVVVERQPSGEIVITFCLGGISKGHVEIGLDNEAIAGGGNLINILQFDDGTVRPPDDYCHPEEILYPGACCFSLEGKRGRIDWDCHYGVFWFHYNGLAFAVFNGTIFSSRETRTENGFSVTYDDSGRFPEIHLTYLDSDCWLKIDYLGTVRTSRHFKVEHAPAEF